MENNVPLNDREINDIVNDGEISCTLNARNEFNKLSSSGISIDSDIVLEKESDHNNNLIDEVMNMLQNLDYVNITENGEMIDQEDTLQSKPMEMQLDRAYVETIEETHAIDTLVQGQAETLHATQIINNIIQE